MNCNDIIDGTWDLENFILDEPDIYLRDLIPGTGPPLVIGGLGGEEMVYFTCGGINYILVGIGYCWNLIPNSLDQVESQMDSNAIHYFEFQTWNLALQPA